MPQSAQDYAIQIASLEREFRMLKRNIIGTASAGKLAIDDPTSVLLFEARLEAAISDFEQLQTAWKQLGSLHILAGTTPAEEWEKGYDMSRNEIIVAKSCLKGIERDRASLEASRQTKSEHDQALVKPGMAGSYKPHLTPIPIPQFSGDWIKWPHFRDTFQSVVHNDPALTDIERLHYLLGALSGEAAALISKFPVEGQSYTLAWSKLKENYQNPRVLASLLLKRILEGEPKGARTEQQRYEYFLTNIADSIEGFRSLALEDPSEFLLGSLALRALDPQTRRNFELSRHSSSTFPTTDEVIRFVRQRKNAITMSRDFCASSSTSNLDVAKTTSGPRFPRRTSPKYSPGQQSLTLHSASDFEGFRSRGSPSSSSGSSRFKSAKVTAHNSTPRRRSPPTAKRQHQAKGNPENVQTCPYCQSDHPLSGCVQFCDLPREQRVEFARSLKGCLNCLRPGHSTADCRSRWTCRFCRRKHHSLIHQPSTSPSQSNTLLSTESHSNELPGELFNGMGSGTCHPSATLLGTAQVMILGPKDSAYPVRAVIDSGSQQTFLSLNMVHKIGMPMKPYTGKVIGLGGTPVLKPAGIAHCRLKPMHADEQFQVEAVVVNTVTPPLPNFLVPQHKVQRLRTHQLADQQFAEPGAIDMLIGMDLYPLVIKGAPQHSGVDGLFLLPTAFGSVVIGSLNNTIASNSTAFFTESQADIKESLKAFWEIEEPQPVNRQSPEDKACEEHFLKTTTRNPDGRYVVRLPLTRALETLGRNRESVTQRFLHLERKFKADPVLAQHYLLFMREYEELNHFSPASQSSSYLIPHHGVWQQLPSGKKLRVVFDASCPSSNGQSLNSILMAGPKLHSDITNILINFRLYRIPLCADLVKMYRQILIHPEDRGLQHVLWRASPEGAIIEMELNTVTYGLRSSAFQALRVIKQLAHDEGAPYPLAVEAVTSSMYVDDIVSGADTIEEARELQQQLISLFAKGGFPISKWASTVPELVPFPGRIEPLQFEPQETESVKILGLIWNPETDSFAYSISKPPNPKMTKRNILSAIARIYDPLGLVSPSVVLVKLLLQRIWKCKLDWDQPLTPDIRHEWEEIMRDWNSIALFSIPRCISLKQARYQLVGFCDASETAYAASIYLRAAAPNGEIRSALLKAKTKVAPLKFTSIARLELCGALLLARLLASISVPALKVEMPICFTDSTVVLSWLNIPPYQLKVFEANRVSEILSHTAPSSWGHVKSEENPADVASRGCLPSVLSTHGLWWHGPPWLLRPTEFWPKTGRVDPIASSSSQHNICLATAQQVSDEFIMRFSEYQTLIRTVARILRLLTVVRPPRRPMSDPITASEYQIAKQKCVKIAQKAINLQQHRQLSPFLDDQGVIRVGGRLKSAPLPSSSKHPIILPRNCHLSLLVIRDIHRRHYHAGPSLTLAILRCEFWIPRSLKEIRDVINRCVHCRIKRAQPFQPVMASLPKERFSNVRAFLHVGLDYAGPFLIKQSNLRKSPVSKAYLCLFVCMSTKAVHLEAVSSMTTEAFLAALDRFVSRRGLPRLLWSDRGSNFIGASRYLKDVYLFLNQHEGELTSWSSSRNIQWKFNPPHAPHFGGLWEAGVKSTKRLLTSALNAQPHTFEELATIFVRVEQMLNSRPLCALNEDPENCDFLTPAHFLIGESLSSIPDATEDCSLKNPKSRWEATHARIRHMWERWKLEYLHTLQQKTKWTTSTDTISPGQLVVLTERRNAVGQWPVGRIVEVYPGEDGVVRTASVRTPSHQTYLRPVVSLAPLFPADERDQDGVQ